MKATSREEQNTFTRLFSLEGFFPDTPNKGVAALALQTL
jgi:hypothetical protein